MLPLVEAAVCNQTRGEEFKLIYGYPIMRNVVITMWVACFHIHHPVRFSREPGRWGLSTRSGLSRKAGDRGLEHGFGFESWLF